MLALNFRQVLIAALDFIVWRILEFLTPARDIEVAPDFPVADYVRGEQEYERDGRKEEALQ